MALESVDVDLRTLEKVGSDADFQRKVAMEKQAQELLRQPLVEYGESSYEPPSFKGTLPRRRSACLNRNLRWVPRSKSKRAFCRVKHNKSTGKSRSKSSRKSRGKAKKSKSTKAASTEKVFYW
jgi:hypothetical protein